MIDFIFYGVMMGKEDIVTPAAAHQSALLRCEWIGVLCFRFLHFPFTLALFPYPQFWMVGLSG